MQFAKELCMREWLNDLESRTKEFAVRTLRLSDRLNRIDLPKTVIWQFVDAGTSVAANHRACRRARSDRELVAKLSVVVEEADETDLWLELIQHVVVDKTILSDARILEQEAHELVAIFSKSVATIRKRLKDRRDRSARSSGAH
jgi:four helix bundle protein